MKSPPAITIVKLPKPPLAVEDDADWTGLAQKFRGLRLRSLETSPEAFASTYEAESQRGLDQTFDRLRNRNARQFIAVENIDGDRECSPDFWDVFAICQREWVGMIVLVGPMEGSVGAQADPINAVIQQLDDGACEAADAKTSISTPPVEFVLNGVFVEPSARGRGIGKALMNIAVDRAKSYESTGPVDRFITVLVSGENEEARKLYEKAGFRVVGEETYTQEPRRLLGEIRAVEKVALKMRFDLS